MRQTIMVVNSPNRIHIYIYIFVSLIPYLDALFVSFLVCTEIVHDYKSNLKTASCQTSYNRCPVSRPGMNTSVSAQQKRHAMKRVIAHTCISSGIVHFQWNLMPQTTFPPPPPCHRLHRLGTPKASEHLPKQNTTMSNSNKNLVKLKTSFFETKQTTPKGHVLHRGLSARHTCPCHWPVA